MSRVVADLHLHSRYSRAVSPRMNVREIAVWARKKGLDLVGTADWTYPLWLKELEANLEESAEGVYKLKPSIINHQSSTNFILSTEISSIYSQGGRLRRIHNLVIAPSFAVVYEINEALKRRGANLMSDGRPIIGLSSRDLCELVWEIDKEVLVVSAHCLLPKESLHTKKGIKKIENIKVGEFVLTHKNRWQKVEQVFSRPFNGETYQIIPDYFRLGITVTEEHPFYAIKTDKRCLSGGRRSCRPVCSQAWKGCARQYFKNYQPEWIKAEDLQRGDVLLFPRFTKTKDKKFIRLTDYVKNFTEEEEGLISAGGSRTHKIPDKIKVGKKFCRLVGYYLAEGYTSRDLVSFCFRGSEKEILEEIKNIIRELFGINYFKEYIRKNYKSIELTVYSKILTEFFSNFFYQDNDILPAPSSAGTVRLSSVAASPDGTVGVRRQENKNRRANNKCLPSWVLELPLEKQKEILIAWWQGDKGYTTSRFLMNQIKIICLRLGIIPSIGVDSREAHTKRGKHDKFENRIIKAKYDTYNFSNLSFFEDKFKLLDFPIFAKFKNKIKRKRGWLDENYIYLPIRKIVKKDYQGKVYNLEVKNDNSYTAEFALVHNCWTPWFALYGSKSGFDSIKECYGEFADRIYAVETGLSSDPEMNWRIKELEKRSIISFSDAHSPEKLMREATVFQKKLKTQNSNVKTTTQNSKLFSFKDLSGAIKQDKNSDWEIAYTIEFHPEEGKYHYTGHRNCGIVQSPEETKQKGTTCPVCGRPLTLGVMHRVEELAGNSSLEPIKKENEAGLVGYYHPVDKKRPPYVMLVPLMEILAEVLGTVSTSQRVKSEYENLIENLGSELDILTQIKYENILPVAGEKIAEAIKKVRSGDIFIKPGFDGQFGVVKIWKEEEKEKKKEQMSLF